MTIRSAPRLIRHAPLALCLALAAPLLPASASPAGPVETVRATTEEAIGYLDDGTLDPGETHALLRSVDVEAVARFALGRHVHRLDDAQRMAYRAAFEDYLARQMRRHLDGIAGGEVAVTGEVPRSDTDVIVETEITTPDGTVQPVTWRMNRADGGWAVVDVQVNDLWLAIEQRAQFDAELDRSGGDIDALIRGLRPDGASAR